jgi:queuine tRNA-ribosyltransferase
LRNDPDRLEFRIGSRDGKARTAEMDTGHGTVRTPAFVPLATKGSVRGMSSREVAGIGYDMVLGNTYHLLVNPGPERIREAGGLHAFMGWDRAIITDSGGFQVFSLAHGGVAEEIKASGRQAATHSAEVSITEQGVRFRSPRDGSEITLSPESSMSIQADLGSDIALVFDECTPFHTDRDYTAESTERTHRWLRRCLDWHAENGPSRQAVFGIVQGGVYPDLRQESCEAVCDAPVDGIAIGGTLGRDKEEMGAVLEATVPNLPETHPRHLLGIGELDDLVVGVGLGIDTFDCAVPTRLARHGMAIGPFPDRRFRLDVRKSPLVGDRGPLVEGCSCQACSGYSRDYLNYLSRAEELTAVRLLVEHNLSFMGAVLDGARLAIERGRYAEYAALILGGRPPWEAG